LKSYIFLMVMTLCLVLVACSNDNVDNNANEDTDNGKLEINCETDSSIELETKNDKENICCGIYTDGKYGELVINENGYASLTLNVDASIAGPDGKYEYKSGIFYIVEDGVVKAAMKNVKGKLHLLKYQIGNETYKYEEGEKVFYLSE